MNRDTGLADTSWLDALRQSVQDILTTPLGSRVMLRDYGSQLFDLQDAPMHGNGMLDVIAATADAIATWEPRLNLKQVHITTPTAGGKVTLSLSGIYTPNGKDINLEGLVI